MSRRTMHVLLIQVELYLAGCHTLKEKRSVMKSLLHQLRSDYNVSVAETEHHDLWQSAVLAFSAVSGERKVLERLERRLEDALETDGDVAVAAWQAEWL